MIKLYLPEGAKDRIISNVSFVDGKAEIPDEYENKALFMAKRYAVIIGDSVDPVDLVDSIEELDDNLDKEDE